MAIKKLKGVVGKYSKRYAIYYKGHFYGYARSAAEARLYNKQAIAWGKRNGF